MHFSVPIVTLVGRKRDDARCDGGGDKEAIYNSYCACARLPRRRQPAWLPSADAAAATADGKSIVECAHAAAGPAVQIFFSSSPLVLGSCPTRLHGWTELRRIFCSTTENSEALFTNRSIMTEFMTHDSSRTLQCLLLLKHSFF